MKSEAELDEALAVINKLHKTVRKYEVGDMRAVVTLILAVLEWMKNEDTTGFDTLLQDLKVIYAKITELDKIVQGAQ